MTDTTPPPPAEARPVFPALDTLRAVGALAVLTTHTTFQTGDYLGHGVWGTLLSRLDVGVAIFFVLSGFLLSRPWIVASTSGRATPRLARYYVKRLLRIYPVYLVTVALALALIPANEGFGPGRWLRTLLLGDVYLSERFPQGLSQMWSLAVEAAFYVVLPPLMLLLLGRRGRPHPVRVAGLLAALATLSVGWHLHLGDAVAAVLPGVPMTWLPAYLTWFAVGIGLSYAQVRHAAGSFSPLVRGLRALAAMPGLCWTLAAGLMLVAATPLAGPTLLFVASPTESLTKHLLYAVVGGLLVATGVFAVPGGRYLHWMSRPALRHLGLISYSTFCIHLPILVAVMTVTGFELFDGHGMTVWLVTLVLSLVASELLYQLVERPGMRLQRLVGNGRRSAAETSTAAATATTR